VFSDQAPEILRISGAASCRPIPVPDKIIKLFILQIAMEGNLQQVST
jgi:hypothetical protein